MPAAKTTAAAASPANLQLWDSLCNTDPAFTKQFNRGGFKGTAINPVYVSKRLTEMFGPVGQGWRLVIENEQYVQGHTLPEGIGGQDRTIVHVVRGHLEYLSIPRVPGEQPDWVSTGPQFGQTTFVGANRNGCFTDEEAPKKSVTDCLGKCALQLGIGADISMGLWDDSKYGSDAPGEAGPKARAPRKAAAAETATASPGVDLTNITTAITTAKEPGELLQVFNDLRASTAIYNDLRTWTVICAQLSKAFVKMNQPGDPASVVILGQLQSEKHRLDASTQPAGANATTG